MSQPLRIVMLGDNPTNPFVIPGTNRSYTTVVGTAINVPAEDATALVAHGWVSPAGGYIYGAGVTGSRPTVSSVPPVQVGTVYVDTTVPGVAVWCGPVTGWKNLSNGATI